MPNNALLGLDPAFGRALRGMRRAPVTLAISALLVACFAASVAFGVDAFSPTAQQLLRVGGSFGPLLLDGEWWRLLSAEFLHGGIVHLAFNLWALWGAGQLAERIYGRLGFLAIYMLSAMGATLLSVAVAPLTVSIGASGAIFGVYGALSAFAWFHRNLFPGEFLRQQRNSLLAFLGYNVVFAVVDRRIDAAGHAGGFAVGIALGLLLWRDLRDPRSGAARQVGAVVVVAALLVAAAQGVRARVASVPVLQVARLTREAADAFSAGQFGVAVEKLSAAIAADDSSPLRLARAHALSKLGRRRVALEDAKVAVDLAPTDALDALGVRGSLEFDLGLREEAARTCGLISNRAPWRAPDVRAGSFAFCAFVYLQRGDPKAALDWADLVVGADPDSEVGLRVRAHVLERTGQFERALVDFDRVIEKAPNNAWALNARAWLRLGSEDFAGAWDDADRAIAIEPSKAAAIGTRCFALSGLGDVEGARRDCARAVELAPPGTPEDRGMLAFLVGDRAAALRLWLEAAPRDPTNRRVLAPWIAKAREGPTR
jgi:membrane associated rhomboid family serine protease/tetratricopeptide (TPR) repeat protein